MNHQISITAAVGLALAAALLATRQPAAPAGASEAEARGANRPRAVSRTIQTPAPDPAPLTPDQSAETANLAAWQQRFGTFLEQSGHREDAVRSLLAEVGSAYGSWVREQIALLPEPPCVERYDELADIQTSVSEGVAAICEHLGIAESLRVSAAAGPLEAVAAETQYAEAARDTASRLALLRLDRERQIRLEEALALADDAEKTLAMTELDAWYESGLGGIFAPAGNE